MKTKTFFLLIPFPLILFIHCAHKASLAPFGVEVSKASVTIRYDSTVFVRYEASGGVESVSVRLAGGTEAVKLDNSYDAVSGKGSISIRNLSLSDTLVRTELVFSSGDESVSKPFLMQLYGRKPFSASIQGRVILPFGEMMQYTVLPENNAGEVSLTEVRGIPLPDGKGGEAVRYVQEMYGLSLPYDTIYYEYDDAGGQLFLLSTLTSAEKLMSVFVFSDGREEFACSKEVRTEGYTPDAPVFGDVHGDKYFFPDDGGSPAGFEFAVGCKSGVDMLEISDVRGPYAGRLDVRLTEGPYRRSGIVEICPDKQWRLPECCGDKITVTVKAGNGMGSNGMDYELEPFYLGLRDDERSWVEADPGLEPKPVTRAEVRDGFDVYCPEKPEIIFEDDCASYLSYGYNGGDWPSRRDDRGRYWIVSFNRAANDTGRPRIGHVQVRVWGGRFVLRLMSVQDG